MFIINCTYSIIITCNIHFLIWFRSVSLNTNNHTGIGIQRNGTEPNTCIKHVNQLFCKLFVCPTQNVENQKPDFKSFNLQLGSGDHPLQYSHNCINNTQTIRLFSVNYPLIYVCHLNIRYSNFLLVSLLYYFCIAPSYSHIKRSTCKANTI